MFRRLVETEISIDASPARVWAVLTDFAAYRQWNPYMIAVSGTAALGEIMQVSVSVAGRPPVTLRPRISECEPESLLSWKLRSGMRPLLASEHSFELQRRAERTLVWQAERFTGPAVPFLSQGFYRAVEHGFKAMNLALKHRAERPAALRAAV
jgi:hypothetical protein